MEEKASSVRQIVCKKKSTPSLLYCEHILCYLYYLKKRSIVLLVTQIAILEREVVLLARQIVVFVIQIVFLALLVRQTLFLVLHV